MLCWLSKNFIQIWDFSVTIDLQTSSVDSFLKLFQYLWTTTALNLFLLELSLIFYNLTVNIWLRYNCSWLSIVSFWEILYKVSVILSKVRVILVKAKFSRLLSIKTCTIEFVWIILDLWQFWVMALTNLLLSSIKQCSYSGHVLLLMKLLVFLIFLQSSVNLRNWRYSWLDIDKITNHFLIP